MAKFVEQLKADLEHNSSSIVVKGQSIDNILSMMLAEIEPVDFRSLMGIEETDKIKIKDYVVLIIQSLIATISQKQWDFIVENGISMVYDGAKWVGVPDEEMKRFLREAAIKMGAPELPMRHFSNQDALYKQFCADAPIHKKRNQTQDVKINLQNGTLTVSTKGCTLEKFKKSNYLTYQLPFGYDAKAECPIFMKFLERNLPDVDCQKVIAEYIASIFCPWLRLEKCLMLYGDGSNGKSVLTLIMYNLLGSENVTSYSLTSLTNQQGYARAEIEHKLLNICSELNSKHFDISVLKAMISQDPIDARRPYGKAFNMTSYAKLLFCCNILPENIELTNAFFRRFLIIPWEVTIAEKDQDKELSNKIIQSELPGVLNWVIEGLHRLIEQKQFTYSSKIESAVATYKDEANTVIMFLNECGIIVGDDHHELISSLNRKYNDYCRDHRITAVTLNELSRYLTSNHFQKRRTNKGMVFYYSIQLNSNEL